MQRLKAAAAGLGVNVAATAQESEESLSLADQLAYDKFAAALRVIADDFQDGKFPGGAIVNDERGFLSTNGFRKPDGWVALTILFCPSKDKQQVGVRRVEEATKILLDRD